MTCSDRTGVQLQPLRLAEALAIEGQEWVPSPHLFLGCGPTVCVNQVQESLLGPLPGSRLPTCRVEDNSGPLGRRCAWTDPHSSP